MAKQLCNVAYDLINVVGEETNIARRRKSRANKMGKLKTKIEKFHNSFKDDVLKDAEKQQSKDEDVKQLLDEVKDVNYRVIDDVLEDAEKKQLKDEDVKQWLGEVKDVYYRVIDVCQEIRMEETGKSGSVATITATLPLSCSHPPQQCRIRDEILQMTDDLLEKIESLIKDEKKVRKDKLRIKPKSSIMWRDQQPTQTFVHDEEKMKLADSRERDKKRIIAWVRHCWERVMLVCIRGMAGIGKSALAREVFKKVKKDFDVAAIVDVSAEFDPTRIARDFVERVTSIKINKNELESLPLKVHMIINGKRFLLVLDGVRDDVKDFKSKWEKLMGIFKGGGTGCTILMTTTNLEKNNDVIKTSHYDIKLDKLEDEDCRSIIFDQAFGVENRNSRTEDILYDQVGNKLVKKCEGLPVIAKALGDVLRDRTLVNYWKQVLESDVWEFAPPNELGVMMKATMLRYHLVLPPDLKQCLLYCSIFPRNHRIDVDQLINLWMSQDCIGFGNSNMEAEGWRRFKELLDRSIFEDYTMQSDSGGFECKLQGAMCDFVRILAENECHILHLENKKGLTESVRHCTVYVQPQDSLPALIPNSKNLHTLMVLSEYPSIDPKNLSSLLSQMRRLRALVLSYCSLKELPTKACELLHLRFLDLSFNRDLKKLPEEICNLSNLQTLNLNGCDELQELPRNIGKLTKLRHLDILWTTNLSYLPKGLTELVSLKRLSRFFGTNVASNKVCNLSDMKHLTNLQGHITIEGLGGNENISVSSSEAAKNAELKKKKYILGLELWFSVMGSVMNHEEVLKDLEAPSELKCLGIFYYRGKSFLPSSSSSLSWILRLNQLTHLILSDCDECDTLPALGTLQSLETLEIKNLGKVETLGPQFLGSDADRSSAKVAFPKLKKLCFQKMDNWVTWVDATDGRDHMDKLTFLLIENCFQLRTLPNYIIRKTELLKDIPEGKNRIIWPETEADKGNT